MNTFDISPFFRSTVGFDRLFDQLGRQWDSDTNWPQYDVLKTAENEYQITLAVPGYHQDDIDIETKDSLLTVSGERRTDVDETQYLYRGIGNRTFTRTFQLAEHVRVENARIRDGLLTIDLKREIPESMRPRKIEVQVAEKLSGNQEPRAVESTKAA
ncbi:MAG: Hsp20 family protein [Gammaproteobacteria bacterium]|nr:Hsp20 family protein [Gammaproteobacteria bacterium]